ncbi:c-type lysozyme inhibitor [Testudinibacter sp. TR-2022]|uniref:c-type lysozyme inhibitor n=1 Tax=Testudinibacter sp. TR-2022 TaxID=2585029 RepID=UPI002277B3EA|nr:c-type lysozyme inhibitor [Testudinibacter sp. TR-2022]
MQLSTVIKKVFLAVFTATALLSTVPALAANDKPTVAKTVQFKKGESSATYKGRVKGYNYDSYYFTAKKGQVLNAVLDSNAHAEMVLFDRNDYVVGDSYVLPESGKYEVRVFQMRTFARRGTESPYTLKIEITDQANQPVAAGDSPQELNKVLYACRDNKVLEVVYLNTPNNSYAVINQMGEMVPMQSIAMASGANYQAINPDYAYKLYTKGNTADLVGANDSPILSDCRAD